MTAEFEGSGILLNLDRTIIAIILVAPLCPAGRVFSESTLRAAVKIARTSGLLVIIGNPYSAFVYDKQNGITDLSSMSEYADAVAYHFTFSKVHAMSSWRVRYLVPPKALRDQAEKSMTTT